VEAWEQGSESFAVDPPDAVLSVLDADGPDDVVIELLGVRAEGDALHLTYELLDGTPPDGAFGPASVFIDPDTVAPLIAYVLLRTEPRLVALDATCRDIEAVRKSTGTDRARACASGELLEWSSVLGPGAGEMRPLLRRFPMATGSAANSLRA
jgi:hypothetical protein